MNSRSRYHLAVVEIKRIRKVYESHIFELKETFTSPLTNKLYLWVWTRHGMTVQLLNTVLLDEMP